jgi:hypothetical protein
MPLKHLTDDRLQEYLDGNIGEQDMELIVHLRTCDQCRRKLETYRLLYDGLKHLPEPDFPPDFAASTAALLPTEQKGATAHKLPGYLLPVLGGVASLLLTFYFVDMKFLGKWLLEIFAPLNSLPAVLNGSMHLLIYTGLILLLLVLVDSFIIQPRHRAS